MFYGFRFERLGFRVSTLGSAWVDVLQSSGLERMLPLGAWLVAADQDKRNRSIVHMYVHALRRQALDLGVLRLLRRQ